MLESIKITRRLLIKLPQKMYGTFEINYGIHAFKHKCAPILLILYHDITHQHTADRD